MKTFAGAIAAFIIIIIGVELYSSKLTETTERLDKYIDAVIETAVSEDWQGCNSRLTEFTDYWDTSKKWLTLFVHHDKVNLISENLSELEMYVYFQNREQAAARANVLKSMIQGFPENEQLSLENLL